LGFLSHVHIKHAKFSFISDFQLVIHICADSNCTEEKTTASVVGQPPKLIKVRSKLPLKY
ncbi:hypothetical protein T08_14189, partial [Trichinella sp. T8]